MSGKVYSWSSVVATLEGVAVEGFGEEEGAIEIEFDEDLRGSEVGAGGETLFFQKSNRNATCTLKLMYGSRSNRWLNELAEQAGTFSLSVRETESDSFVESQRCVVMNRPSLSFGETSGVLEWTIAMHNPSYRFGELP